MVIGAGISGLGAARLLGEFSSSIDTQVLEARDRIGGRIVTIQSPTTGVKLDLGASWIHGIGPGVDGNARWKGQVNPLYKFCRENSIKTFMTWKENEVGMID